MCHFKNMHESSRTRQLVMSYEWVMSRISMSHVTYMNVSYHMCSWVCVRERGGRVGLSARWMSHVTHQWVMPRTWICHITGLLECVYVRREGEWVWVLNESCHTSMSHVTYMNLSHYRCTWVCMCDREGYVGLSARWISHVNHQWVMSHICICHITHRSNPLAPPLSHQDWGGKWVCSLAHTLICWFDRTPSNMWHVAWIYVTWCIHIWNMKYFPPTLRQQYRERPSGFVRSVTHHAYMNVSLQVYMSLYAWEGGGGGFECFLTHHTYKYRHIYSYK